MSLGSSVSPISSGFGFICVIRTLTWSWQVSCKGLDNILGFEGHTVSITNTHFCHCNTKANRQYINEHCSNKTLFTKMHCLSAHIETIIQNKEIVRLGLARKNLEIFSIIVLGEMLKYQMMITSAFRTTSFRTCDYLSPRCLLGRETTQI